ncbi:MAG: FHA domain-containing protein [Deltaproteobacteria bacterium]|nr:FHA domain-containing protein [Deltaproteobacteria bacterium]
MTSPRGAPRRTPGSGTPAPVAEDTRPPVRQNEPPVAARVIVPKMGARTGSDTSALPKARLVYRSVEGMETEFVLEEKSSLGRHPKNSIRLHDREVSKEHAVIERNAEAYTLRDLNSSNGTFVNNRRIREVVLRNGDELMFGSMRLVFRAANHETVDHNSVKDLITILPATPAGTTHIHATLEDKETDFQPGASIADVEVLRRDYDKLRIAHELSRMGLTLDFSALLAKTLDVAFSLLPADNGVILVVDPETGVLLPHTVKRRDSNQAPQEIVLSSTIINQVINDRTSVLLSDAFLDPRFSGAQSIISQGIRSAMVVPLVANNTVYGVMHLDSRQRIGAFTEKDLQLLKALAGQAATAIANTRLVRKVEEDAKTRGQLSRFLPPHVVEQMVQGRGQPITKGGRECDASVLFCDIRGFTPMSEASTPQEIVNLLNDYFERLVEAVFERHGVLDKFIGDAMMAHWGTLQGEEDSDHAFKAVATALQMREAIREFNRERIVEGRPPVGMGVGVNSGRLVAGYMGAKRRLEYTVIGDTVNTSSRLCGLAQPDQILISEVTHQRVADRIEARYLGSRQLKGKEQGVQVYEVLGLRGAMSETGS